MKLENKLEHSNWNKSVSILDHQFRDYSQMYKTKEEHFIINGFLHCFSGKIENSDTALVICLFQPMFNMTEKHFSQPGECIKTVFKISDPINSLLPDYIWSNGIPTDEDNKNTCSNS